MSTAVDPLAARLADRPDWQVAAVAVGIVLGTLLAVLLVVAVATATAPVSPLSGRLHLAAVGLPAVLGLYEAARRWLARAPAGWFLAGRPGRPVLGWAGVGLAFPAAVLGLQLWLLGATVTGPIPGHGPLIAAVLASAAAGLLAGVLEELALRGALFRVLEARWGARTAVVATAVVFAALHQGHAGGPVALALVLTSMLAAGLLLGVVVVRTRSVWTAVALHAGWNTVFGGTLVAVTTPGATADPALLQFQLPTSAPLLTGGAATIGAAPFTTACLALAAVVVARARWVVPDRLSAATPPTGEP